MSDGISDMHREEERKAAELIKRNCFHCKYNLTGHENCRRCSPPNFSSFAPSQSAIDAKVEELRSKEEMSMHYKKDDLEIDMEVKKGELKVIVEHPQNNVIVEFLINMYKAINPKSYLSTTFTYGEEYELLIQRKAGETPAEKAVSLERNNAEMLGVLNRLVKWNGIYNDKPFPELKSDFDIICEDAEKLIKKVEGK